MASIFDVPRSLITMSMELERKVFESFTSTLKLNEHSDDSQDAAIILTLGELRQHVQWCQYAAQLCDTAAANNREFSRMTMKARRAEELVRKTEEQFNRLEELAMAVNRIHAESQLFRRKIDEMNKARKDIQSELGNAKTNHQR